MSPGASKNKGKSIDVPVLEENGNDYINWKIRINKWTTVTNVPKSKRARRGAVLLVNTLCRGVVVSKINFHQKPKSTRVLLELMILSFK